MPDVESDQNSPNQNENAPPRFVSEPPDWEFWRQRGACRIWQAVLLSMNVEPTSANRAALRQGDPKAFEMFTDRREIVLVQYGVHPLLPAMEHSRAGQAESNQYVLLSKLLEFAKEIGWRNLAEFETGLSRSVVSLPEGATVEVEKELDDLEKGERYALVRMGALLTLLEQCLQPDKPANKNKFLTGKTLNYAALGKELAVVIATQANQKQSPTSSRFSQETNRKQIAAAVKALQTFF